MLDYGFVVRGNPHDAVELTVDPSAFDAVAAATGVAPPNTRRSDGELHDWQTAALAAIGFAPSAPCETRALLRIDHPGEQLLCPSCEFATQIFLCVDSQDYEFT